MLRVEDLTFSVQEKDEAGGTLTRKILDGLTCEFQKGGFYAITGPNGCGKTTLSRVIMGMTQPTSGSIFLDGEDITKLSVTERARKGIAYSFQHPARFKGLTLRDLLSVAMGTDNEEDFVRVLARVGVCSLDFLDKEVGSKLSGGEIKKVELATTIARNPRVAIYDEPDTGIDLWTIGPMVDLIRRECEEYGTTAVVISHNEKFLESADEILLMKEGRIVEKGTLATVLPFLKSLDFCSWKDLCEGIADVRCHR